MNLVDSITRERKVDMLKVFISGPIDTPPPGDQKQYIEKAMKAAYELSERGFAVYLPHAMWFVDRYAEGMRWQPLGRRNMPQSTEWLKLCDMILRIPGVSYGALREEEIARECKIPIYTSVEDLIQAVEEEREETKLSYSERYWGFD